MQKFSNDLLACLYWNGTGYENLNKKEREIFDEVFQSVHLGKPENRQGDKLSNIENEKVYYEDMNFVYQGKKYTAEVKVTTERATQVVLVKER